MRDPRKVILREIVTEKTAMGHGETVNTKRYAFEVVRDANKHEIKYAVEKLFNVNVQSVRTSNFRGKSRRRGVHIGRTSNWKKAVVKLVEGQTIEIE